MKTLVNSLLIVAFIISFSCNGKNDNSHSSNVETTFSQPVKPKKHIIKVALLLDTSNSMDGLIDQAKAQLWEIVNELSYARCKSERPELEIALYEYGNDRLSASEGYIRQVLYFTQDLDEISKELFSLTTNGGSEYCGQVIKTSLNQLEWGTNPDDLKMVFIAGNEPFTQGKVSYKDATTDAKEKGVIVNTIFCGDYNQGIGSYWKDGADLTSGDYMAINHNVQTVHIPSPYDDLILQLNIRLNKTYVPYGYEGKMKITRQTTQDDNAAEYSKANAVSRTVSKGSHLYKNSSWDLVDAEGEEGFNYDDLKKEQLPEYLKDKTTEEIKQYVATQKNKRSEIQNEIQELNKKRRTFIAEQEKVITNGLESAMIQAIKKQALKKNYKWDE